jgi:hypothetical protein
MLKLIKTAPMEGKVYVHSTHSEQMRVERWGLS